MNAFSAGLLQQWRLFLAEMGASGQALASADGWWREVTDFALMFPVAGCVALMVFAFLHVLLHEHRLPAPVGTPEITVVIAAHNEAAVLERALRAVLASEGVRATVIVVSDGSTDDTVRVARGLGDARIAVHDLHPNRGKSAALQHALDLVTTALFVVVDADTVVTPGAVRLMTAAFADARVAGVTGNVRVARRPGLLNAMQAMEYAGIIGLVKRAQRFWGGLFTVSGAAACFRTEAVRAVGGWSPRSVTEDIELSWRLQTAGWELAYEPRAVFRVEAPPTLRSLWRQRQRWARGMVEVLFLHRNLAGTRNPALIPIYVEALAAAVWAFTVLATVVWLAGRLVLGMPPPPTLAVPDLTGVVFWTTMLFAMQTLVGSVFDDHYDRGAWKLAPFALLYPVYYWIVVFPSCVIGAVTACRPGGAGRWGRTERAAPGAASPPSA